jgi:hypothetical protein
MYSDFGQPIVYDGPENLRAQAAERVHAEVRREFDTRMQSAGPVKRLLLRLAIRREVERRLEKLAPPSALYAIKP